MVETKTNLPYHHLHLSFALIFQGSPAFCWKVWRCSWKRKRKKILCIQSDDDQGKFIISRTLCNANGEPFADNCYKHPSSKIELLIFLCILTLLFSLFSHENISNESSQLDWVVIKKKNQLFCKSLQEIILWKLISLGVDWVFLWTESKTQSFPSDSPLWRIKKCLLPHSKNTVGISTEPRL